MNCFIPKEQPNALWADLESKLSNVKYVFSFSAAWWHFTSDKVICNPTINEDSSAEVSKSSINWFFYSNLFLIKVNLWEPIFC